MANNWRVRVSGRDCTAHKRIDAEGRPTEKMAVSNLFELAALKMAAKLGRTNLKGLSPAGWLTVKMAIRFLPAWSVLLLAWQKSKAEADRGANPEPTFPPFNQVSNDWVAVHSDRGSYGDVSQLCCLANLGRELA